MNRELGSNLEICDLLLWTAEEFAESLTHQEFKSACLAPLHNPSRDTNDLDKFNNCIIIEKAKGNTWLREK